MPKIGRRRLLQRVGAGTLAAIAGCTESGGDGSGSGDATTRDAGTATAPATATGTAPEGTRLTGSIALPTRAEGAERTDFEELVVAVEELVFRRESGPPVTVDGGGATVDLATMQAGVRRLFARTVPFEAGEYTEVDCHLPVQRTTLSDPDATAEPALYDFDPGTVDLSVIDPMSVGENGFVDFRLLALVQSVGDGEWRLVLSHESRVV